jgi:SAM-dependent methyltransferase
MHNYRERAYERYSAHSIVDFSRFARSYDRRLTRVLQPMAGWTCLDVACGYGNFLAYLRAVGIAAFTGIDTSEAAVQVAQKEFGAERAQRIDAFEFLASYQSAFDLISAIDFIEHVSKAELYQVLDSIWRALRPGGLFLLRVPNANGLFGMASRYNDITHELCFTPGSITDLLQGQRASLDVVRIWEDQGQPESLAQFFHWGIWNVVRFCIRCVDASETGMWGDGVLTRNMWVLARKPLVARSPTR